MLESGRIDHNRSFCNASQFYNLCLLGSLVIRDKIGVTCLDIVRNNVQDSAFL